MKKILLFLFLVFLSNKKIRTKNMSNFSMFNTLRDIPKIIKNHTYETVFAGLGVLVIALGIKYRKNIKKYFFSQKNEAVGSFEIDIKNKNGKNKNKLSKLQIYQEKDPIVLHEEEKNNLYYIFLSCKKFFGSIEQKEQDSFFETAIQNFNRYILPIKIKTKSLWDALNQKNILNKEIIEKIKNILKNNNETADKIDQIIADNFERLDTQKIIKLFFFYFDFELSLFHYSNNKNLNSAEIDNKNEAENEQLNEIKKKAKKLFDEVKNIFFKNNNMITYLEEGIFNKFKSQNNLSMHFLFQLTSSIHDCKNTQYIDIFFNEKLKDEAFKDKVFDEDLKDEVKDEVEDLKDKVYDNFQKRIKAIKVIAENNNSTKFEEDIKKNGLKKSDFLKIIDEIGNAISKKYSVEELSQSKNESFFNNQDSGGGEKSLFHTFYEQMVKYNKLEKMNHKESTSVSSNRFTDPKKIDPNKPASIIRKDSEYLKVPKKQIYIRKSPSGKKFKEKVEIKILDIIDSVGLSGELGSSQSPEK